MRKIIEILRLSEAELSQRQINQGTGICRKTIREYIARAKAASIRFADIQNKSESEVYALLFAGEEKTGSKPLPDWKTIHQEMSRPGVTLALLWEEYLQRYPNGYKYSQFCDLHRAWRKTLDTSMRQVHKAGEKMFVDYSGLRVPIVNRTTGETKQAEVFVSVLGTSNYTFATATWTQQLPDWIDSHVKAFEYYGGTPEMVVPDNLKSAVTQACRYEPDINRNYQDMAIHYGVAVVPARPAKPKDKSKVEAGVCLVQRWILARLRNHTFFTLHELNEKIREWLEILNHKPFRKLEGSRKSLFEQLDKPALKPLPGQRYEFAVWKKATVNIDCHAEVERHFYSVPCQYIRAKLEVRITSHLVMFFKDNRQVAIHPRSDSKGHYTTAMEHLPKAHQEYGQWTPEQIIAWTQAIGPNTRQLANQILTHKYHPVQGYRAILGLIRLEKKYGRQRLEVASARALVFGAFSFQSIKTILGKGLDKLPLEEAPPFRTILEHENIRGAEYYGEKKGGERPFALQTMTTAQEHGLLVS